MELLRTPFYTTRSMVLGSRRPIPSQSLVLLKSHRHRHRQSQLLFHHFRHFHRLRHRCLRLHLHLLLLLLLRRAPICAVTFTMAIEPVTEIATTAARAHRLLIAVWEPTALTVAPVFYLRPPRTPSATDALNHADGLGTTTATMADPDRRTPSATAAPTVGTVALA